MGADEDHAPTRLGSGLFYSRRSMMPSTEQNEGDKTGKAYNMDGITHIISGASETVSYCKNDNAEAISSGKSGILLYRSVNIPQPHNATSNENHALPTAALANPVKNKFPIAMFAYSVFCLAWWLVV